MQIIVISVLIASTTFDFLISKGALPGVAKYSVELLGAVVGLYVIAAGTHNRFRFVRAAYWVFFGSILLSMICGVLANRVEPGPIFAGIRSFLRAMPLFFLPAVYEFSERQIKTQLGVLLAIATLQLPLAVVQRMATFAAHGITGDNTFGTMMVSSFMSIFLICVTFVVLGLYLRKLIGPKLSLLLFLILIVPTTINETKGTLVLLPIGLITVFLLGARPDTRIKSALLSALYLCVFGAIFIPIYDSLIQVRPYPTTIGEFFTKPGRLQEYLSKPDAQIGTTEEVGRMDSIVVPVQLIAKEPSQLVFGLGAGNASKSSLGPQFTGSYNYLLDPFLQTAFSVLVSELGLLGLGLVLGLHWLIFSDCRKVASYGGSLMSGLALGWAGVAVVMVIAITYKNVIPSAPLSYLFWYFSGLIAAERMRVAYGRSRNSPVAQA